MVGFESRTEAERFLREFRERLAKFGLELHPEKTRLIEFGQFAARNRKQRGEGKTGHLYLSGFRALLREAAEERGIRLWTTGGAGVRSEPYRGRVGEDGVTLEIVYEGRTHNAEVPDKAGMDTAFQDVFSDYDLQERLAILGYARASSRIPCVAKWRWSLWRTC